jgi:hypothetical protein
MRDIFRIPMDIYGKWSGIPIGSLRIKLYFQSQLE